MTKGRKVEHPVRLGVVGLGLMGKRHCQVISAVPGAELAAVCDHHEGLTVEVAREYEVPAFDDFDKLITSPDLDGVVICLPSGLHAEFGIRAANAGKHVVVEKPVDSQLEQGKKLIHACESAGVQCAVISQNRYSDGLAAMKHAVATGLMGTPVLARATVKWYRHDAYYTESHWRGRLAGEHGGVLINQAVHSIDTLQWLFGVPTDVAGFSHCTRRHVLETEDTAVAVFRWQGGMVATLEACTSASPGFDEAYEVHSPVASIKVEKGRIVFWNHNDGVAEPSVQLPPVAEGLDVKLGMFYRQYLNVVAAIRGAATLDVAPSEALSVVETIERIYRFGGCQ